MPASADLSRAQIAFDIEGAATDQFLVLRYRGTESLCQLYRFEIELVSNDSAVALGDVVGKPAVLSLNDPRGERWFHGIISRFTLTGQSADQAYYRAELVPQLWLLTQRYDCRIYQNKSVPDIIADVLQRGGLDGSRVRMDLQGQYEPREYCVQYRETDYNFVSRLMEEEGIWWCFEQTLDTHTLILADAPAAYAPISGDPKVPFAEPSGLTPAVGQGEEHVSEFRVGQAVRPGSVTLTDFDFKNPLLDLETNHSESSNTELCISDYPGEYTTQSRGSEVSRIRSEELASYGVVGTGRSNCRRLACGQTFSLFEHPAAGADGEYVITSVTHSGRQAVQRTFTGFATGSGKGLNGWHDLRTGTNRLYHLGAMMPDPANTIGTSDCLNGHDANGSAADEEPTLSYEADFQCIPAGVVYRPARVTRRPIVHGTQTARVVGPENEEIHTDEYGRVRVQFPWDRQGGFNEDASCWIRVCQGMAGGQYGMMFLPRIGQEVVVDFLEGDPDKPLVVGRVYNADHMPPYPLPAEKTKSVIKTHSSKGGQGTNEIRFEDLADKEQLFIQAQRRMDTRVKADHYHTAGGSYHLHVGGEYKGKLSGEYRQTVFKAKHVHVKGEQRTWIEGDESGVVGGNVAMELQGSKAMAVAGNVLDTFDMSHKHEVKATYHLDANMIKLAAPMGIELKCGASSIVLSPAGVFIEGPMINIANGPGPAVPPAELIVTGPAPAEDAAVADRSEPGRDKRYSKSPTPPEPAPVVPDVPGHEFDENDEDDEKYSSWLDIELVDQNGKPVPYEPYEVTDSEDRKKRGTLDRNGYAHVTGVAAGPCQVTFPRRDYSVWQKAGTELL